MADSWYYVWKPSASPITVELSLIVIERLKELADCSAVGSDPDEPGRIVERGGVLIGRREESGVVVVDDFEEVVSDHPRGASFTLSYGKRRSLGYRLEALTRQRRTPVGYFRTHSRAGLYLDQDDDVVAREFFSEPWQVVLLATCAARSTPVAGIFVWNDGEMDRREPAQTFSLDASELWTTDSTIEGRTVVKGPARGIPWSTAAAAVAVFAATAVLVPALVLLATGLWANLRPGHKVAKAQMPREITLAKSQPPARIYEDTWTPPASAPVVAPSPAKEPARRALHPRHASVAVHPVSLPRSARSAPPRPFQPEISLEPVRHSALGKAIGHIPLISRIDPGHNETRSDFVPAHPRGQAGVVLPEHFSFGDRDVPVDLRIHISRRGDVASTRLVSRHSDPMLASLARQAASKWDFSPARVKDKAVASDMLVHFRFRPATQPALLEESSIQRAPVSAEPASR